MPTSSTLALFALAVFGLIIIPGPNVMYIITRSVEQGRRAGLMCVLGVAVGTLVHIAGAALGLSALLVSSALAFDIVKYVGALYLIFIGVRTLRAPTSLPIHEAVPPISLWRAFSQGVIVNIFNPKTTLFILAFLPQFIDPARGPVTIQVLMLGGVLIVLGVLNDCGYALLAGTAAGWLKSSTSFARFKKYASGCIYIGLGITAALVGSERTQ